MQNQPPVFLQDSSTLEILRQVANNVPSDIEVYLFGGAIRNALYYSYFNEEMTQRDFDCIVIGDPQEFAHNLEKLGFIYGAKNSDKAKVLKKARIENPSESYNDWLYLDCKIYSNEETIESVLQKISDFSINGVALDIKELESSDWLAKVIELPNATVDIQEKKLRIIKCYSASIYKILRLVSQGFKQPTEEDVTRCLEKLKEISREKFDKETTKTIKYIGDEGKVLKVAEQLGIKFNILNFEELQTQ